MDNVAKDSGMADAEIEITPEMIEAGVTVLRANQTDDPNRKQVRETVTQIFAAMSQVQRQPQD